MSDWQIRYYAESIENALDENGWHGVLNKEQIDCIADAIIGSVQNEGMARGPTPENSLKAEINLIKHNHQVESNAERRRWEDEKKELEWTIRMLRGRIAELERVR